MPIAFRSVGARLKADIGPANSTQTVAMPAGHAAGDLLLLVLTHDSNTDPATPSGWTRLGKASAGTSTSGSNVARVQTLVYWRLATGVMPGASFTFPTAPWPAGSPYVLAFCAAYSGVDPAGPIEKWSGTGTASTAASQQHPQLTTVADGDWLLTIRTGSAWEPLSTTIAGATNTKRVDDTDGFWELFAALYDSDTTLTPGTQTRRTTFATGGDPTCYGGSTMWSIALKAVTVAAIALPGAASAAATAYSATVTAEPGGWDLCGAQGLPAYRFAIDWGGDGVLGDTETTGAAYVSDAFGRTVSNGWGMADTGQAWTSSGVLASDYSVASGAALHTCTTKAASRFSFVTGAASPDMDASVTVSTDQTAAGGGSFLAYLLARLTDISNCYLARLDLTTAQTMLLSIRSRVGGTETVLASATLPYAHAASTGYRLRLRVLGPDIRAKCWPADQTEPGWQAEAQDGVLSAGSGAGVRTNVESSTTNALPVVYRFDDFRVLQTVDDEDVAEDIVSDVTVSYGRDQERQLGPAAVGSAAFTLNNSHRRYSPENAASPLYGDLDPARAMRATVAFNGQAFPLFTGRIDDFEVHADFGDRTAGFTFLDGLSDLSGVKLSTAVYASLRTGDLIHAVLDLAGWTGGRDIDPGATVVKYWWAEGTDALSAIGELVKSEGPPAVAYVAPDGSFTFRDRHHRLLRQQSLTSRATFSAGFLGDCEGEPPVDGYSFTKPFTYAHGWRDIVNTVAFDVEERGSSGELAAVWTDESTYSLAMGQSVDVEVSASNPFIGAVTPVPGVDVVFTGPDGAGVDVVLSRDSGVSAKVTLRAVGGPVTVTGVQLRAWSLAVQRTVKVTASDPGSVTRHGERAYPDGAPWAGVGDAEAIANTVLLHYANRRPTVQIRVVSQDPAHFMQVLQRTVSDRIRVVNAEQGLDSDFFVERVTHTVQRTGRPGRPPVHAMVLGCEQDLVISLNAFTFDQRGSGFDQGVFDRTAVDDPAEVFVFDDPVQGQFDRGRLGT